MSDTSWILTAFVLTTCAACVGTVVYVMLVQPLLEAPVHGMRGLKRARARSTTQGFATLEPIMRWLAARCTPLWSSEGSAKLQHKITVAGELWGLWPAELRALGLLCGAAAALVGSLWVYMFDMPGLFVWLLAVFGLLLPSMQVDSIGRVRIRKISRRIPHIVDLMVLSLGAGLDFPAALRQVVERSADPQSDTIEELGLVLEELKLGSTRRKALEELALRAPCDEVRDLVSATIQAEEQGTPLGVVLETQASTSRQRRSTRAEEAASKASTAMVLPLALVFISLMVLIVGPTVLDALGSSDSLGGMFK